jgi:bifunctional DNase/RNase
MTCLKIFADRFDIVVKQVIIHKLVDGVFYSSIICERDKIEEIIDARTSDAIALALRFNAPIFTYKTILDKAGIYLKFSQKEDEDEEKDETILVDEVLSGGVKKLPNHPVKVINRIRFRNCILCWILLLIMKIMKKQQKSVMKSRSETKNSGLS